MIKNYKVNTLIPDIDWSIPDIEIEKWFKNKFINNKLIALDSGYIDRVCFHYALDDNLLGNIYEAIDYLIENYNQIKISQIKTEDIITYGSKEDIKHFGIIHKTNNTLKGTIIKSKWGTCGIFETDLYSIPKSYGKIVNFWRKIQI